MSELIAALANPCETSTPNRLNPPPVRLPKLLQGVGFAVFRRKAMRNWINRHERIFEIDVPFFGRSVVVSDPALVRSVCTASAEELSNVQPNLGNWFGPGSVFGLDGSRHRDRRRLLAPAFHGQSLKDYEKVIEDETLRESANWPEDKEFRILEPMNRITLNVILRILFGADGVELEELREIVPPYMRLGQLMAFVPVPPFRTGRHSPWGELDEFRKAFDRIVFTLIDRADSDPSLGERTDILALLRRSRNDDGTGMTRLDISDELLTLIGAGRETTASAVGWAFERLRRHPEVLAELVSEVDEGAATSVGPRYAFPAEYSAYEPAQEKPTDVGCDHRFHSLFNLSWSSWGADGAEGTGNETVQTDCNPSCAAGSKFISPIQIRASDPRPPPPETRCPQSVLFLHGHSHRLSEHRPSNANPESVAGQRSRPPMDDLQRHDRSPLRRSKARL